MSRQASEYRKTEYPNMSKYWDDMRMLNLNKYTYKPNKNDFLSLGCSFKVFQDIYRVCAKENNCPPAYISNYRNSFPRLKEEELKNLNNEDGFNIPFIGNKITTRGLLFGIDGVSSSGITKKCLKDFGNYIAELLKGEWGTKYIDNRVTLLFLKHIVKYKGMTLPKNQDKLRKYKKKIADIDKFLKNEDTLKDEGLGNNIGVKSRGYYETDDEQENYPTLESESLKEMYKEILNDKMIKDYVIKMKKNMKLWIKK